MNRKYSNKINLLDAVGTTPPLPARRRPTPRSPVVVAFIFLLYRSKKTVRLFVLPLSALKPCALSAK